MKVLMQIVTNWNGKEFEPLGSNNQIIFDDLKTLKGILNRIKKYNINRGQSFRLYRYSDLIADFHNNRQGVIYEYYV